MLKFFRRIRLKLLDKGNLRKYLAYAIGEIFLVVIGILIAIQINSWNENRLRIREEALILKNFSEEIKTNSNTIKETIKYDSMSLAAIEKLLNKLRNNAPYTEEVSIDFNYAIAVYPVSLSSSTVENLRAKGVDIIRSNEIRAGVLNLFDIEYSKIAELYVADQQSYNNVEQIYLLKNFEISRAGMLPNNYQLLLHDQEIVNILSMRKFFREASIVNKRKVINKSEELLMEIQSYLNK